MSSTSYETSGPEREPSGMRRLVDFVENGLAAQQAVDEMTGPVVSVEHAGLPSPDHHAVAAHAAQVSLNTRLELGRILVQHRNRDDDTAGAIDAILALFDAEAGAR